MGGPQTVARNRQPAEAKGLDEFDRIWKEAWQNSPALPLSRTGIAVLTPASADEPARLSLYWNPFGISRTEEIAKKMAQAKSEYPALSDKGITPEIRVRKDVNPPDALPVSLSYARTSFDAGDTLVFFTFAGGELVTREASTAHGDSVTFEPTGTTDKKGHESYAAGIWKTEMDSAKHLPLEEEKK